MKIVEINMVHFGSTGKIMLQIAETARNCGHEALTFSPMIYSDGSITFPEIPGHIYYGTRFENRVHNAVALHFGGNGCASLFATFRLLHAVSRFKPDIIHLHNLHSACINLPLLFRYIKRRNIRTIWTLHDCWSFTGHCPYFDRVGCDKWRTGCFHCPQYQDYPSSNVDNSRWMYALKKKWFTGVKDMTLVTPSNWLAGLVKQSYMKEYPVQVIHNGIDLQIFQPIPSGFRKRYDCEGKFLLLGVAFDWGIRKGLDVFIELAHRLDSRFQIVLVGTNDEIDRQLPESIISIHRTESQTELAEIYTAADLFVIPTREDNFPTVNLEALACGTPVVTFRTGGSPECIDETCGSVVECDDIDGLEREIRRIKAEKPYTKEECINRACMFDKASRFQEYIQLYERSDL